MLKVLVSCSKPRAKSLGLVFILFFSFSVAHAQKSIHVVSSEDGAPIGLAHIQYQTSKSSPSKVIICDKDGTAQLPITAKGGIYITIYHIGYKEYNEYYNDNKTVEIRLDAKAEFLNESVVTQQYTKRTAAKAVEKIQIING